MLSHVLFQMIMHSLYEHGIEAHLFQHVGHGGRVAKGIYGPSVFRLHGRVDVSLEPFVTKHHLLNDRIVV